MVRKSSEKGSEKECEKESEMREIRGQSLFEGR